MSAFFPNFLFLDFPESVPQEFQTGWEWEFERCAQEKFLSHFQHFFSTLLLTKPFRDMRGWNLVGFPDGPFYSALSTRMETHSADLKSVSFPEEVIDKKFKEYGYREGINHLVGSFFSFSRYPLCMIIGLSQQFKRSAHPEQQFYSSVARGLHSQPIWLMRKTWLNDCEEDILYLSFSLLAENYYFIDVFPFILYDCEGMQSTFSLERSLIESPDSLKKFLKQYRNSPSANNDWIQYWDDKRAKEMLETFFSLYEGKTSPIAFKQNLIQEASSSKKKILLVEGYDIRVLKAIDKALYLGMERLSLMGERDTVQQLASDNNLEIMDKVEIIEPQLYHREYTPLLYETLKHKNISREESEVLIKNDLNLAGLLLQKGVVDGVVAGAHYSTADTLKAAIRMVGVKPDHTLISSFFIMLLPQNVMLFADCAVNPTPSVEQLAEITLQTIGSAQKFLHSQLRVSLISFSTMGSAQTPEVEKITQVVKIATDRIEALGMRDVLIEGPVQYDTAINPGIAIKKFQESQISGRSNVLIFPNLETGNTVYKAVQQSHPKKDCHCLGPIIQGLKKPYNDLSRGATVDDILQTIFITAIQSSDSI